MILQKILILNKLYQKNHLLKKEIKLFKNLMQKGKVKILIEHNNKK